MDLLRVVYHLRPDVTWDGSCVNAFSVETLRETYQSSQPFPTPAELSSGNEELQVLDDAAKLQAEAISLAQEEAGLDNMSVEAATAYVNNVIDLTGFDNAQTIAEIKAELRRIIVNFAKIVLKMIPYLLRSR